MSSNPADLLPQARIRLAALELFGAYGFRATTVRQIAERAGVSPGLVIHHFGSKDALREACDAYAIDLLGTEKAAYLNGGMLPQLRDFLADNPEMETLMTYLVQAVREGGETADRIHTRMCAFTEQMMEAAAGIGAMRMPRDRAAAAAILTSWSLGLLVQSENVARRLGGTSLLDPGVIRRYADASLDLFTGGLITADYAAQMRATLDPDSGPDSDSDSEGASHD